MPSTKALSLGWRGTEAEWHRLRVAIRIFAFAIIPVMFSVHTIVSWDFAVAQTAGLAFDHLWPVLHRRRDPLGRFGGGHHSVVLRSTMRNMNYFIRAEHFDALGKLILVFSLAWGYFFFNEYILHWYGGNEAAVKNLLTFHATGPEAWVWYTHADLQLSSSRADPVEQENPPHPVGDVDHHPADQRGHVCRAPHHHPAHPRPPALTVRLGRDYPSSYADIAIAIGTLCFFIFLYLLASRVIPLVPVWEVQEGQEAHMLRQVGKTKVPSVSELE